MMWSLHKKIETYGISCDNCWVKGEGSFEVDDHNNLLSERTCVACVFNGGEIFRWALSSDIVCNIREELIFESKRNKSRR